MTQLWIGLFVFFATHLIPRTPLKAALAARLGEGGYKGLFSLLSLAGIGFIVWGFMLTRAGPEDSNLFYEPPEWTRYLTTLLMLLASLAIAASWHKGRLGLALRHPLSIGIGLWALAHLVSIGQVAQVYLFGAFLLYALFDILTGKPRRYEPKPKHDLIALAAGGILFLVFLFGFHPWVLNLPVWY